MPERNWAGGVCTVCAWFASALGLAVTLSTCNSSHPLGEASRISDAAAGTGATLPDATHGVPLDSAAEGSGVDANESTPGDAAVTLGDGAVDAEVARSDGGRVLYRAIAVTTGELHACAILDDHNIKCWGHGYYGQLGYGDMRDRGGAPSDMGAALPIVDLGTGRTATAITAGRYATCAILNDGSLKCWGWGGLNGQPSKGDIGDEPGEMGDHLAPLDFGGRKALHVAIGENLACASTDDDTIWCWGGGAPTATPQLLELGSPPKKVKALSGSGGGVFALYDDGTVGPLIGAQDGVADLTGDSHKAVAIAGAVGATTCAVLDNGTTACIEGGMPQLMDVPSNAIALGVEFFGDLCALLSDGSVQCLGHGCDRSVPMPPYWWCSDGGGAIALGQSAVSITSGGQYFACALLVDGGIKCWGGDPTMPPREWFGSEIAFTQTNGGYTHGAWNTVDLGTHP
jgi:hypothetical protein